MDIKIQHIRAGTKNRQLKDFLIKTDCFFMPNLSSRVNIEDYIEKIMEFADHFCAFDDLDNVVACGSVYFNNKEIGYITSFVVDPNIQHQGYGTLIMCKILEEARREKINKIDCEVFVDNQKALKFYKKNGFEIKELSGNWIKMGKSIE